MNSEPVVINGTHVLALLLGVLIAEACEWILRWQERWRNR